MFGWRYSVIFKSVVEGGFDHATKIFEEGFPRSFSGNVVWLFGVPTHLMPADPVSRHIEDLRCDLNRSEVGARENCKDLEAMYFFWNPMGGRF